MKMPDMPTQTKISNKKIFLFETLPDDSLDYILSNQQIKKFAKQKLENNNNLKTTIVSALE